MVSSHCFCQSKLDSIQFLEEVVITKQQIAKEIIPVQTLSGEVFGKLNAHSVADALRYFSGVQLKDYGGIGGLKTVNIRSMGSQHVGVFYDGIEIGNAQNGVVDLGRFSLDNMDAISLYNGQKSAIFQPAKDYASASSIYMIARSPQFRESKKYNFKGTFKTGAFDLVNPSILWEQAISKKISSSLNLDYLDSSGKYKFTDRVKHTNSNETAYDTTATRRNGDIEYFRIEHALFGKISDGEWKTRTYFYQSERGYPGSTVKKEPGVYLNEDRQWDKNFFFQASFKKRVNKYYSTLFSGKYAHDYLRYLSDPEKDEQVIIIVDNTYKQNEVYLSSANMFSILPNWNANISVDYQWNKMDANLNEFMYPIRHSAWMAAASSLYLNRLKLQASILTTLVSETSTHNIPQSNENIRKEDNWHRFTPTIIASIQPWDQYDFHVRAFYKKIFRMPTFNEIFLTIIGSGASNLKPEYATQYNLGATYVKNIDAPLLDRIEGQVDVYYNEITDKLLAVPGGQNFRWTMMNLGRVRIKGVDVAFSTESHLGRHLALNTRINYTYQQAKDYSYPELDAQGQHDSTYKGQIAYIPWHSGSVIFGTDYKSWGLSYSVIYSGDRYTGSANIKDNKVLAWYTHDLALNKTFRWKSTNIKATTEVNNLFNQQYDVVLNYPMPGTNFKFILKVDF